MKNIIRITVLDKERYDGDWPPEDAAGAIAWLSEKLESIPEAFRSTAKIEFDSVSSDEDSHYARIEITYSRPETDEEEAVRLANNRLAAEAQRSRELQQLEDLRRKYEGGT